MKMLESCEGGRKAAGNARAGSYSFRPNDSRVAGLNAFDYFDSSHASVSRIKGLESSRQMRALANTFVFPSCRHVALCIRFRVSSLSLHTRSTSGPLVRARDI